jgi:hypothetical protein
MPPEEKAQDEPDKAVEEDGLVGRVGTHDLQAPAGPNWENLISAGLTLLNRLSGTLSGEAKTPADVGAGLRIETDESTGQRHLKLPVPSGEVLRGIASFLTQLAEKL